MSDIENSSSSYFASEDPQWLFLVTLFVASVVTVILYFVQYFQQRAVVFKPKAEDDVANKEAASLLGWALSLKSWKSQWREAWCRALSAESRKLGGPVVLTFEEDDVEAPELTVSQVYSFHKSARNTAFSCHVTGEKLQFSVSAALASTAAGGPSKYTVCVAPLKLQLDLFMEEREDEIKVTWRVPHLDTVELEVTPTSTQDNPSTTSSTSSTSSTAAIERLLRQLLCAAHPSVLLSHGLAQASDLQNSLVSPPKPPRAHDWKLLVKNIQVTLNQQENAAGSISPLCGTINPLCGTISPLCGTISPLCVLQLDDPPQRFHSSVLMDTSSLSWEQPFIFELNGLSKEIIIQLVTNSPPGEGFLLGQASVPLDLVKKQPSGQQTFSLMTTAGAKGSLTTEFTYLEPSEVRSWHPPTPAYSKKVEMDRTVMPCGTVVTTITAVKSKPGRALPPGLSLDSVQKAVPARSKLSERRVSEQASMLGSAVSKALSSSDTELLMLNGTDPVAEAAIRQLHQSAKQKLKSPVKKSTIIISGISKAPLSQDDELALMAGYAAAMDASMMVGSSSRDVTVVEAPPGGLLEESTSQEGEGGADAPPEDWESQADDLNHTSLSTAEVNGRKSRGSFLQKSAKFFFRRRHQRKDPGMSQSHNDLVYLESPAAVERARRTATFNRLLHRRSKTASKANGSASTQEPPV